MYERNAFMTSIRAIGTAVPPYVYDQDRVAQLVEKIFSSVPNLDRYLTIFENTGIHKRHFSVPIEWFLINHTFAEKNQLYRDEAIRLSAQAITNCLQNAQASIAEIDHLFFVSSTGFSTPSIDAHLSHLLGCKPHMKRTPIWGLGCAGGTVGISRAFEYVKAFPEHQVMVVAVELCGLTFLPNDRSKSNLVATSLFADGAAAVMISGNQSVQYSKQSTPKIKDTMSTIFPNSLDIMGWELNEEGLKVIFSRDIPSLVREVAHQNAAEFLKLHQLTVKDMDHFILHPGGKKVLDAYEEAFQIGKEQTQIAREIIAEYGNMSSATVLFVLERYLSLGTSNQYGIIGALGPGFSSELVLLQW